MKYQIRKVEVNEIQTALNLALLVFMEFEAPYYEPEAVVNFKNDITENKAFIDNVKKDIYNMFIALDKEEIIGVIADKGNGHVCILFVEGKYHRNGIATALMDIMICTLKLKGINWVTLNSSPYGLPFYVQYGFSTTDSEQKLNGFIFTPMKYEPNEIWDI